MPEAHDLTDAWLVDATRQLADPPGDVDRLISSISAGLNRIRRPARPLRPMVCASRSLTRSSNR